MRKLLTFSTVVFILLSCGGGGGGGTVQSGYPIHKNIKTTWFYVGEQGSEENEYIPNISSAWDDIWLWHYGGTDDPFNRLDYYPAKFVPSENPFYFALPFNDFDENGNFKEIAKQIPWYKPELLETNGSILKNRWIKIIKGDKVAYAQWEDVGPFGEDDFDYVFGNAQPSNPINGAGLDVSPAVRDYLGLEDVDYVDWQFVDENEVPPGPWKEIITTTPVTWLAFAQINTETTWYWQLHGDLRTDIPAKLYDVDLFDTPEETIQQLKENGKVVICYFSAGTYENWRPDANRFKEEELGNPLEDWEGERWIDIRSENVREIMKSRLDLAKEKGCDGIEPDNVDGYLNNSGFPLTYEDQLNYNRFLAIEAKKRVLLVGLKNDLEQIEDLVTYFDFALNEQCHEFNECDTLMPFIEQGKPVFNAEYSEVYVENETAFEELCSDAMNRNFKTIVFPIELDGSFVKSCDYGNY
ncbi:endo alpha-1,4 polygalactosaminidase [Desulfurobacterium crinifex]